MLCWKTALDLNAMMEIPLGGESRKGPNLIPVPEHSTWEALAASLQAGSSSNNPHHPWAASVRREGGWKVASRLRCMTDTSSQLPTNHFSFPSDLRGWTRRRHRINSALSQFGGGEGNGSLVRGNRSNRSRLGRLTSTRRRLLRNLLEIGCTLC